MTPAEVLSKAADLIEERGWTQGVYQDEHGCLCAIGAIQCAATGRATAWSPLASDVGRFLLAQMDFNIATWNDRPGRTKDEVVAALRGAAERAS